MWVMKLRISRWHHTQLLDWALAAPQMECCGIIFGRGRQVTDLLLATNVAPDPAVQFEIDPSTLIAAQRSERKGQFSILGYFHSHPNGLHVPSRTDADMAISDGRIWLIIAANAVSAWVTTQGGTLHGRFNPILLVVDEDGRG